MAKLRAANAIARAEEAAARAEAAVGAVRRASRTDGREAMVLSMTLHVRNGVPTAVPLGNITPESVIDEQPAAAPSKQGAHVRIIELPTDHG